MNIEEIALKLQETTDRSVRNEGRIKKLETEQCVLHELATSVAVLAEQVKNMNANIGSLTGKVDKLEEKPRKRWDGLVEKIITVTVGAIVGYILIKLGF